MRYSPKTYASAFWRSAEEKFSKDTAYGFFKLIRRNGALAKLPEIIKAVEAQYYEKSGIARVEVVTAREMRKIIEPQLRERFGREAEIKFSVNPEIAGGIILKINDETVIDASAKRRIDELFKI